MAKYKSNYQNKLEQGWIPAWVFIHEQDKAQILEATGEQSPTKAAQHILNTHLTRPYDKQVKRQEVKVKPERLTPAEWDDVCALYWKLADKRGAYNLAYAFCRAITEAKGLEPYGLTAFKNAIHARPDGFETEFMNRWFAEHREDAYQKLMDSIE